MFWHKVLHQSFSLLSMKQTRITNVENRLVVAKGVG